MNKISFLLPFLMLVSLISMGQNIKHISFDFNINDFKVQQDHNGNVYVLSDNLDYFLKSDTLQPALPYIGYNILIGSTEKYDRHICSGSRILFQSNVTMAPNPKAIPTNCRPSTNERNTAVSYSSKTYPTDFVEYVGTNEYDDYRVLTFHVCPFEYDSTSKKLYLKTHIDLNIQLKPSTTVSLTRKNREAVRNSIKNIVINPEDIDNQDLSINNRSNNNLIQQTGFEYVIVTSNQFKSIFQQLANWKNRKGIRSKVLTIDDVSAYGGSTTKEQIKNALADIDGLSYVLLGGDTINVPTCMCYIGKYSERIDSITPADSYYSCLGTINWNINNNGFNGEIGDSVSLVPYLNVSRAPVSTVNDAQVFVDRIINYESAPDTANWLDNILMCGTSLGYEINNIWHPYYVNGISDTQIWSQRIYNDYIHPTSNPNLPSWNGELTRFYDTYSSMSLDDTYDFNITHLQDELAKGYTFADVMTHGDKNLWRMEGNEPFSFYSQIQGRVLVNSGYTVITTIACNSNAFDHDTPYNKCLSQELFNNSQSGIISYWGTSRENWYYVMNTSNIYLGALYDALTYRKLFEDKYHRMGKAVTEVKMSKMSSALGGYSSDRKIWMSLNLMGDPEMPVYLSKPKVFQNVDIQFVNDNIYTETGVGGFDICFINQADSTDYFIARDIDTSNAIFGRQDGSFDVCITKPGYIPYSTVCDKTFLQNITMMGTKTYETGSAMIGSNVTNKINQGAVVINSGSTTIKVSQGATITKDFEVKLGAEFTITNE